VLANHDQPQWAPAHDPEVSCIGGVEMAHINIEASVALARWIDLIGGPEALLQDGQGSRPIASFPYLAPRWVGVLQPLPGVERLQFRQWKVIPDGGFGQE
jgi:hypothetical protein